MSDINNMKWLYTQQLQEQYLQQLMIKPTLRSFVPLQRIGEGTFSSVYKVRRISDNGIYALKKIKIASLKDKEKQNALNQIRILASLSSQYIVTYKEAFFDENLNLLCIVMEWADEGDLLYKINKHKKEHTLFDQIEIWRIAYHLSKGLDVLHKNKVLHRDMKSANVFISRKIYKIGDLNVSKVLSDQKLVKTQTGTPYYASPQLWRDQPYGEKSDIWSLGCILYEICALRPPFLGDSLDELFKSIQSGKYIPIPQIYSTQLRQFIGKCLKLKPECRPNTNQLLYPRNILLTKCQYYEIQTISEKDNLKKQPLLSTIKMPFDIKCLNNKLPHPKYEEQSTLNKSVSIPRQSSLSYQNINNVSKRQETIPSQSESQKQNKSKQINGVVSLMTNNSAIPQKIKKHLENISNKNPHEKKKQTNKTRYRIHSSIGSRGRPLLKQVDKIPLLGSAIYNSKKLRPLSCDIRRNFSKVSNINRPSSGITNQKRIRKNLNHVNLHQQKQQQSLFNHYCYQKPQPSYKRHIVQKNTQNERCQSAEYRRPVNSSYAELKKRFQSRQKQLHSSLKYDQKVHEQISKSQVNILSRPAPFILKDVYLKNSYASKKVDKPQNRAYLEEIQNKILNCSYRQKKCVITNSGANLEAQRIKGTYNQYRQIM